MKKLILELDYMSGPIFKDTFDIQKAELCTGIDIVDNDEKLNALNDEIQEDYSSLYQFNENEQAVSFDRNNAKKMKEELIYKINELIKQIERINDGSFVLVDHITDCIQQW